MNTPEQERMEQNIRRAAGIHTLREVRHIVDEDLCEEAARKKWLRAFLRYGWIVLLLAAWLLGHFLGVI